MALGAVIARIVSQYSDKGSKLAQKDINKLNKKFDLMGKRALLAANTAAGAFATLSIKIGKDAVKAAVDDAKSQALLANTLQNVTGASTDQINAVEAQIEALSKSTGVLDDELRPSLQQFLLLTKDVEKAQFLQGIAVQLAAAKNIDVAEATDVVSKAYRGQFKGLQNLGIALDENILKNKDAAGALKATMDATKGATDAANKADPFRKLNRDLQEMYETLGKALLPVIIEFVNYLRDVLVPELTKWIELNRDELQKSLEGIAHWAMTSLNAAIQFDKGLRAINLSLPELISNLTLMLGVLNLIALSKTFGLVITELTAMRVQSIAAATATTAAATGTAAVGTAAATAGAAVTTHTLFLQKMSGFLGKIIPQTGKFAKGIALIGTAFKVLGKLPIIAKLILLFEAIMLLGKAFNWLKDKIGGTDEVIRKKVIVPTNQAETAAREYFDAWTERTEQQKKDAEILAQIAKDKAAADKRAAQEARIAAIKANIAKKFGVKLLDEETRAEVDAKAILYNLERGRNNAQAELIKQSRILEALNKAALEEEIKLRTRLQDILKAYSDDQKVDIVEIGILAKLWGTTSDAAALYVDQIIAVADQKISDDEVKNLSAMWGISKEQAAKYLDFVNVVSDGKISDAEINNLAKKWNMTKLEVMQYADFIIAVQDQNLNDEEVQRLKDKWGLTNEQVTAYILAIGAPVKYAGTILDPNSIKALETAWNAALAALIKYKNALGQTGFTNLLPNNTDPNAPGNKPDAIADANAAAAAAAKAAADAAAALAESEAALAASKANAAMEYAKAKAAGDSHQAALFAAQVSPSKIAAGESGAIGAASIAAQLKAAEQALAQQRNAATYAAFKAKERADEMAATTSSLLSTSAYDPYADEAEKARIRRMQGFQSTTLSNAAGISGGNLMAAPIVNVTVQGSVTTEQDLVSAVRNGLLYGQSNGNTLTLQAI